MTDPKQDAQIKRSDERDDPEEVVAWDIWQDIPLDNEKAMCAFRFDLPPVEIYAGDTGKSGGGRERDGKLTHTTSQGWTWEVRQFAKASGTPPGKLAEAEAFIKVEAAKGNTPWRLEEDGSELAAPWRNRGRVKTARLARLREERDALLPPIEPEPESLIGHNRPPRYDFDDEIFRQRKIDMRFGPREIDFERISFYGGGFDYKDGVFNEDAYGIPKSASDPELRAPITKATETKMQRASVAREQAAANYRLGIGATVKRVTPEQLEEQQARRAADEAERENWTSAEGFEWSKIYYADRFATSPNAPEIRAFTKPLATIKPERAAQIRRRVEAVVGPGPGAVERLIEHLELTEDNLGEALASFVERRGKPAKPAYDAEILMMATELNLLISVENNKNASVALYMEPEATIIRAYLERDIVAMILGRSKPGGFMSIEEDAFAVTAIVERFLGRLFALAEAEIAELGPQAPGNRQSARERIMNADAAAALRSRAKLTKSERDAAERPRRSLGHCAPC